MSAAGSLVVADHSSNAVTIYASGATGNVKPAASIAGPDTGLDGPAGLTFDAAGDLWVSNSGNSSLTEYPVSGNGDVAPLRTITGPSTGLRLPSGVDVDATGNIYVANELGGVTEFGPGSVGNAAPAVTLSEPPLSGPQALAGAPSPWVRTRTLPAARAGHRYRVALTAVLGTTPYRWRVSKGALPAGLTLSRAGILAGRPRRAGVFRFTAHVTDSTHPRMTATRRLVLTVHPNRKRSHV